MGFTRQKVFNCLLVITLVLVGSLGNVAAAGPCEASEETKQALKTAMEECAKSLKISENDDSMKDIKTTYDDKGLILCSMQKLKLASDDGTLDTDKTTKMIFDAGDYSKASKACCEKSEAQFKGESDKLTKARKNAVFWMICMQMEICPEGKKP